MIPNISNYSLSTFAFILFGYSFNNCLLSYWFYYRQPERFQEWKIQPKKGTVGTWYFHPLLASKADRGPLYKFLTSLNLTVASLFAAAVTEASVRGLNKMQFDPIEDYGWNRVFSDLLLAVIMENVLEYYWHRTMHTKFFYARCHKFHHQYKSPEPWDDMYIHPLEAFGYYCILYAPPFVFQCHLYAFILYMLIMGTCGVLDHCGVIFSVPGIYDTRDHDAHHELFEVNYAFPFPFMDMLHGTYQGTYLGKTFTCRRQPQQKIKS